MTSDLRLALRLILTHRWFSAAIVVTLALGIGLNTMVFTLVYAVLFKPVPVPGGERLVVISNRNLRQAPKCRPIRRFVKTCYPAIAVLSLDSDLQKSRNQAEPTLKMIRSLVSGKMVSVSLSCSHK
ncbi:MAG: hypothetical protein JJE04_15835 [Acidobacteriia bacterium]|nr:hypothetical protein [Terriglobia bacterium]